MKRGIINYGNLANLRACWWSSYCFLIALKDSVCMKDG